MKSSKAEAQTRRSIQEKIVALEENTSLLKDYSWLSQVPTFTATVSIKLASTHW